MATELTFIEAPHVEQELDAFIIAGKRARLRADDVRALLPEGAAAVWDGMLASLSPGDTAASTATWIPGPKPRRLTVIALSDTVSRHVAPGRPDALSDALRGLDGKGRTGLVVALDAAEQAFAAGCAVARAVPRYSHRSRKGDGPRRLDVAFVAPDGSELPLDRIAEAAEGIRLAGELVDMPASELSTTAFVARAREVAAEVGATIEVIEAPALAERGFGGLAGVGRAAVHPPALVHLSWAPDGAEGRQCWVGKGIVYDTGGLSIKTKSGMPGMKGDMAGAAAVLGAFRAAARLGVKTRVDALLCLAENSVAANAIRPDDVLEMYSGKTVEVNNTDAEGRLVLADGVAYAGRHLAPDAIIDLATLTGAQLVATGKRHAALVSNDAALEARAVAAGLRSGDLTHPLLYAPELLRAEFKSRVADMKNSVKDRMNAQSSCAAVFIGEHLGDYKGPWLHVDIAGPAETRERGTGFGVALLLELLAD